MPTMTQVDVSNMTKYVMTDKLAQYTLTKTGHNQNGDDDLILHPGDELHYKRGTIVFAGEVYKKSLEPFLKWGWAELAEGEETDFMVDRLVNKPSRGQISQNARLEYTAPQQAAPSAPAASASGVQLVDGVETLPDNWDDLKWSNKRAYILNMFDAGLLEDLLDMETEPPVLKAIKARLADLSGDAEESVAPPEAPAQAPPNLPANVVLAKAPAAAPAKRMGRPPGIPNKVAQATRQPAPARQAAPRFKAASALEQAVTGQFDVTEIEEAEVLPTSFAAATPPEIVPPPGYDPRSGSVKGQVNGNKNGDRFTAAVTEEDYSSTDIKF